jgi:Na+/H+-dicarboxylate symporter
MNSQINAVIIAALAGLTIEVLRQSSRVIPIGHIPPLDIFNPFNLRILGYWVGVLGVLPLICIAIAIGATARKAGLRNSILPVLARSVISLVIHCAVVAVATAQSRELPLGTRR